MKKKLGITIISILMLFLSSLGFAEGKVDLTQEEKAYLEQLGPITMAVDPDWKPFEYIDGGGNFIGIAPDLIELVGERLGIEFEIVPTQDWGESLEVSKSGGAIILPFLNRTEEREEWLTFTETLFTDPNVIITRQEFPFISNLEDLTDRTVVLPEGTSIEERVRRDYPNLEVIRVKRESEIFEMIEAGQADLTIRSLAVSSYIIRRDGHFNLKINSDIPEYKNELRMGVLKDEEQLRDILDKAILTISPSEREEIFNRHVNIVIEESRDYTLLRNTILLAVLIAIFMAIWNIKQREINRLLKVNEDRFNQLALQSDTFIWEMNHEGVYTYVSPTAENVIGYRPEEMVDRMYFYDLIVDDKKDELKQLGFEIMKRGEPLNNIEFIQKHKNGTTMYLLTNGIPIKDSKGEVRGYRATDTDITERKLMEIQLEESERKHRLLFENAVEAIVVFQDGKIMISNPMAEHITGYGKSDLQGKGLVDLAHPDDYERVYQIHIDRVNGRKDKVKEVYRLLRRDGSEIWVESKGIAIDWRGKKASLNFVTDITDRKKREEEILHLSYHDQLTGIYNRRFFEEEMKRRDNPRTLPLSFVMVDVNGLKLFNDGFGHEAGDELISKVARVMDDTARAEDLVARLGGDEFVVLMSNTSEDEADIFVSRLRENMGQQSVNGLGISASMGHATRYEISEKPQDALNRAEERMYHRKLAESKHYKESLIDRIMEKLFKELPYQQEHSNKVRAMARSFSEYLNLEDTKLAEVELAGYYHDIGKISVDKDTLEKKEQLDEADLVDIERHSEVGYQLLRSANKFLDIATTVLHQHENWDGSGYPQKLKAEEIPLESRILRIVDAYEDMTSDRPYRRAMEERVVKDIMARESGKSFDPELLDSFFSYLEKED